MIIQSFFQMVNIGKRNYLTAFNKSIHHKFTQTHAIGEMFFNNGPMASLISGEDGIKDMKIMMTKL